jgi:hypothetical protein
VWLSQHALSRDQRTLSARLLPDREVDEPGELAAQVPRFGPLLEAPKPLHRPQQLDLAGRLDLSHDLDGAGCPRPALAAPTRCLAHRHLVLLHAAQ